MRPQANQPMATYSAQQAPSGGNLQFGHRSNMTVVGNQPGAPKSAAEMARAIAAKSAGQTQVTVPHQAGAQAQGAILDQISRSVNQKRSGAPNVQGAQAPAVQMLQQQGYQQQGQQSYPQQAYPQQAYPQANQQQQQPARRGSLRRR